MATKRARSGGLAGRMITFSVGAIVLAVIVIGAVSVAGVYDLAQSEDRARLQAYRQLLADDITSHLMLAQRIVDSLGATDTIGSARGVPLSRALEQAADVNAEYIDALVLAADDGTVRGASRPGVVSDTVTALAAFKGGSQKSRAWFAWQSGTTARSGELWVARRIADPAGGEAVLLARVRSGFMSTLLDEIALETESRYALVVAGDGRIIDTGVTSVQPAYASLDFRASSRPSVGEVALQDATHGPMDGFYQDVTAIPELGWRVVVLESRRAALARARAALVPAAIATLLATAAGWLATAVLARRLVAPLRAFERHARDVASGGYVRPLTVERDDEIGQLAAAFNDMGARLNSLQDVSQLLAGAADPEEVLDAAISAIAHILGTSDVAVLLTDPATNDLVLARGRGLRSPDLSFRVLSEEVSPLNTAVAERRPVPFEGRSTKWARSVFELFDAQPDRSGVAVPLDVGDDVLGAVVALSAGAKPVTQAQIETLRAFSAQAAVAVRTSRLFAHEQESRREAEALREVAELLAGTRDLDAVLTQVADIVADLLGMAKCVVALDDRSMFGLAEAQDALADTAPLASWRDHAVPASPDGALQPVALAPDADPASGGRASPELLVPLTREGRVRGVLALTGHPGGPVPGPRQAALARTLGQEVSLALEKAALLQEARARAANLETVFRISQAVSSSLQISVVLNRVLDVVQKIYSADAVSLMAYDPAKRVIETSMARGVASRDMLYFTATPGHDIPGQVFASRNPETYPDLTVIDTPLARLAADQGLRSLLAVPLLARGRSIGVLSVYDRRRGAFSAEDRELLLTFAAQAALAIDTASLYGREHHVASVLQASVLPERLPDMPGLELASFYLPAGLEAEIGGDYYDVFAGPDGTAVMAIGDVCGKGVRAATKTSMIKYFLRGMIAAGMPPSEALARLNSAVASSGDPSDIVTAWIGVIDRERRTLTYADGGHPPALLLRRDRRVTTRLGPTGPLLGAIEGARYDQTVVAVEPGDMLITYTDGVTEARRDGRFFGEGHVRRAVRGKRTADAAVAALLDHLTGFCAGVMHDDAAVLAVRLTGGATEATADR